MRKLTAFSISSVLFIFLFVMASCSGGGSDSDGDTSTDGDVEAEADGDEDTQSDNDIDIDEILPDGDDELSDGDDADGDLDPDAEPDGIDTPEDSEEIDQVPQIYTISEIQNPASQRHPEEGEYLGLENVIVSQEPFNLKAANWKAFFITTEEGGEWNAMTVIFNSANISVDIELGDKLELWGTYQEWCGPDDNFTICNTELVLDSYSVTGNGDLPDAFEVASTASISNNGSLSQKYQGALVKLLDVVATSILEENAGFVGDSKLPVNKLIYSFETPGVGTGFNYITGFLYTSENSFRLLPRSAHDFDVIFIPDGDTDPDKIDTDQSGEDSDIDSDGDAEEEVEPDMEDEWDFDVMDSDPEDYEGENAVEEEEEIEIIHPYGREVIINEFMNNPEEVGDEFGEWFALYNTSDSDSFNLMGCSISNSGNNWHVIAESLPIAPGQEIILGINADSTINGGVDVDYEYEGFQLGNSGDAIRLKCDGETIDNVYYSYTSFHLVAGHSQSLDSLSHNWLSNDNGANWCASQDEYGEGDFGTPGSPNPECHEADGDSDEETPEFPWPAMGDIVFTEIMVTPAAVTGEHGQWIEIFNTSDTDVDLQGCGISNSSNASWHLISAPLPVPAGNYAVLALDDNPESNGGLNVNYQYEGFVLKSSGDDAVRLHCDDSVIDEVFFSTSYWPIYAGRAMSLAPEMSNSADNDNASNWCRAIEAYGDGDRGTPGAENTPCGTADGDDDTAEDDIDSDSGNKDWPLEGELVISEIMPWPMAASDAYGEWFEVRNISGRQLDLEGCSFSNASDSNWNEISYSLLLGANGNMVFGSGDDYFSNGGVQVDFVWSGFQLGNTGDTLRFNCGETSIDTVAYTSAWPASVGTALSLDPQHINAVANDSAANWCAATQTYGQGDYGTPGNLNPDCDSIPDGDPEPEVEIDVDTAPGWPASGQVIFTEIMNNPSGVADSVGEWVELTNIGGVQFDLKDCEFSNGNNANWTAIPNSLVFGNMQKVVLGRSSNVGTNGGYTPDALFAFDLDNTSDTLRFRCGSTLIDEVAYDSGFPLTEGYAMNLSIFMFSDMENDYAENWCESTSAYGSAGNYGTPGASNILCETQPDGDTAEDEIVEDESDAETAPHASIYQIQNVMAENHPAVGSLVSVGPVIISSDTFALDSSHEAFYVAEPAGGYYSGMMFVNSLLKSRMQLSPGDSITCTGVYTEYCNTPGCTYSNTALNLSDCIRHSQGNALPAPIVVASAYPIATGGYMNDALQGVAVSVENVIVTEEMDSNGEWMVDDTLIVGNIFDYSYIPQLDENIVTLSGILHTSYNEYKLEPRSNDDIELEAGACMADAYEINNTKATAASVTAGNFNALTLCEGDTDWYAFSLNNGDSVKIDIFFHYALGDIDMYLESASSLVASAETDADNEHISYTAISSGTYYLHVAAVPGAVNGYKMSISINGAEGFTPTGTLPGEGDLVISEFLADASGSTDPVAQWFEIYNPSFSTTYNLEGVRIRNGSGSMEHEIINGGSLLIKPRNYMLFAISNDKSVNGNISPHYTYTGLQMQADNDGLELYSPFNAETIDEVNWSQATNWYIFAGFGMNLDPLMFDTVSNDSADNWCYASFVYGGGNFGTPGAANRSCGIMPDGDSDSGDTETTYEWPTPGQIVITEFMKNPAVLSDANGEWIEIYNADPNHAHEMGGCRISNGNGGYNDISGTLVLQPGQFALLAANGNSSTNGGITADYAYGSGVPLGNDSDSIVLICDNIEVDRVDYTDSFGDTEGRANLLDPRFPDATLNNYASYWCTSSHLYDATNGNYGTPGAVNDHNCY